MDSSALPQRLRSPSTPSQPSAVPKTIDSTMSTAWTYRNDVGADPSQDRESFQIATANRGQITQFHSATRMRKTDHRRESFTLASMPEAGGPARSVPGIVSPGTT